MKNNYCDQITEISKVAEAWIIAHMQEKKEIVFFVDPEDEEDPAEDAETFEDVTDWLPEFTTDAGERACMFKIWWSEENQQIEYSGKSVAYCIIECNSLHWLDIYQTCLLADRLQELNEDNATD